jgi:2,3-bisphosphoglycerate-dependent phosphoglycerate mutase
MAVLVLLRHGESEWNKEDRFTGWTDVGLSAKGEEEARKAGSILKQEGLRFDVVYTSLLRRAVRTALLCLEELGNAEVPIEFSWRLNERHYGALQGLNKKETARQWGAEQVKLWRRSFSERPPALSPDDPRHPRFNPAYRFLPLASLPATESLQDVLHRVRPLYEDRVHPDLLAGKAVLVVAHGNSLRALAMYLEGMDEAQVLEFEIPTGLPRLYELDSLSTVVSARFLGRP